MKKFMIAAAAASILFFACCMPVLAIEQDDNASGDLLEFLGIAEAGNDGSAEIQRSEYALMIARALRVEGAGTVDDVFSDISADDECAPYIGALHEMGIINGSGSGLFEPARPISVSEAALMAVRALGYAPVLKQVGETGADYRRIVNRLDLTGGMEYTDHLTVKNAEILVYRMLLSELLDMVSIDAGGVNYSESKNQTMLSCYWSLNEITGVVIANEYTHLSDQAIFAGDGEVIIGGETVQDPTGQAGSCLGKNILGYQDENGKLVFAREYQNTVLELTDYDSASYRDGKITYDADKKQKSVTLKNAFAFLYNGRACDFDRNLIEASDKLILVDNDRDNRYEVLFVEKYAYGVCGGVNHVSEIVFDSRNEHAVYSYARRPNKRTVAYLVDDDGVKTELPCWDLPSGAVLRVIQSQDGLYTEITASEMTVYGEYSADDNEQIFVDDQPYKRTDYAKEYYANITLGSSYLFRVSDNGLIVAVDLSGQLRYGYLVDVRDFGVIDSELRAKLFDAAGVMREYAFANKVYLDGERIKANSSQFQSLISSPAGVIRYSLNQDNQINAVDTLNYNAPPAVYDQIEDDRDALYCNFNYTSSGNKKLTYRGTNQFLHNGSDIYAKVGSGTVVFRVGFAPGEFSIDEQDYSIGAKFFTDTAYMVDVYNIDDVGEAGCIVCYSALGGSDFDNPAQNYKNYSFGVVDEIVTAVNEEGDIVKKLFFWSSGAFKTAYMDAEAYNHADAAGTDDGNILSKGDVFSYSIDEAGNITKYRIYYDFSERKEIYEINDNLYLANLGALKSKRGSSGIFVRNQFQASYIPVALSSNIVFVDRDGDLTPGTLGEIPTIKGMESNENVQVFIWARYTAAQQQIVFLN